MEQKICVTCNKPGEFYASRNTCKECVKASTRQHYQNNRERYLKQYQAKYVNDPEPKKLAAKRWREAHPERKKSGTLLRLYGITLEEYQGMLTKQKGLCSICQEPLDCGRNTAVDHNHSTSVVRGLLCSKCNIGVGQFRDSPDLLRRAAAYLETANV